MSLGYEAQGKLEWSEPPNKSFGDLSFRVAYQLAKQAKKKPPEIATELAQEISKSLLSEGRYVASVEGHQSGFLNFRIKDSVFFLDLLAKALDPSYGRIDLGEGGSKTVLVEHTAVNPNKALHIGHLRNVAIGDSVSRIFKFTRHNVSVLNYIDDSGLQVADILVGLKFLNYPEDAPAGVKYDHYAGDSIYVEVNKQYAQNPTLKEKQKFVLKAIEERDPDVFPFAAKITDRILREQLVTCWRFGAFYDLLVYESDIIQSKLWEYVFSELKARGIARHETEGKFLGCWIVTVPGEKEGEDKVLVRADGTATYVAKDTPLAGLKVGLIPDRFSYTRYIVQPNETQLWRTRAEGGETKTPPVPWGADKSITVIDTRQARLQRIITHILDQLAGTNSDGSIEERNVHLGYAIVSLSQKTASSLPGAEKFAVSAEEPSELVTMSGRKGTYINADDVLDAVKSKALEETKKRNTSVTDEKWLDTVSEQLAISAVRFSLLKQDLDKIIVFDLEDALQLIGETGPYMLYTFARASSITSKIGEMESEGELSPELLNTDSEVDLMKLISKFDIYVERSVKMLAPKWIAHFSFELCEAFNKFYEKNRVIQEENVDRRHSRIALVLAFRSVLKNSLELLGIQTLERI